MCKSFDIDRFLADCSTEFETSELQISSLKIATMKLKNNLDEVEEKFDDVDENLSKQLDGLKTQIETKASAADVTAMQSQIASKAEVKVLNNLKNELKAADASADDKIEQLREDFVDLQNGLPAQHWTVDGNKNSHYASTPECQLDTDTNPDQDNGYGTGIGYTCCDKNGKGSREGCITKGAYTFAQAVAKCKAVGKTLCTREQIEAGAGAATGCHFDDSVVWTSTRCFQHAVTDIATIEREMAEFMQDSEDETAALKSQLASIQG